MRSVRRYTIKYRLMLVANGKEHIMANATFTGIASDLPHVYEIAYAYADSFGVVNNIFDGLHSVIQLMQQQTGMLGTPSLKTFMNINDMRFYVDIDTDLRVKIG